MLWIGWTWDGHRLMIRLQDGPSHGLGLPRTRLDKQGLFLDGYAAHVHRPACQSRPHPSSADRASLAEALPADGVRFPLG